jgi:hypothetical protein
MSSHACLQVTRLRDLSGFIPSQIVVHNARLESLPHWPWPPTETRAKLVWYAGDGALPGEEQLRAAQPMLDQVWVPTP